MDELSAHSAVNHRYLFEQWLREQYPDTPILTVSPVDDRYLSPDTSLAWSAWNAAWNTRAASGGDSASLGKRSDGMLPDELVQHSKEWYRLCERRFSVERMTISGELAEAIVACISRLNEPFGKPEQFDVNEQSGNSRQLPSLERRGPAEELLRLCAEPIPVAVEDGAWFMVREQDALDAITAALASSQPVGAAAPRVDGGDAVATVTVGTVGRLHLNWHVQWATFKPGTKLYASIPPELSFTRAAGQRVDGMVARLDLSNLPTEWPWDEGSPCLKPRPIGMVYPALPTPRAFGYLDSTGVEWAAYDTGQMEDYGRRAFADGANTALRAITAALANQQGVEKDAERYRWLRDNCFINQHDDRDFPHAVIMVQWFDGEHVCRMHPGHHPGVGIPGLDSAIDAAMSTQPAGDVGREGGLE